VASITSPEGIVNYEYDAHGRRVRTFTGTAADPVNDFHYEYDELNRLTKVTVWERNNVVLPAASREMTQYEYDLLGNLDLERKPNGVVTDYAFDALSRLDKLTHYSPDATPSDLSDNPKLAEFDYTVRADGKRTRVDEYRGGNQTGTFRWEYDAVGRLVDEIFDSYEDNSLDYRANYAFDLAGNRLEKSLWKTAGTVSGTPDEQTSYAYDANDRLLEETLDLLVGSDKRTAYAWGAGNGATFQTGKSVTDLAASQLVEQTNYSYNLQGRLSQAVIEKFTAGQLIQRDTSKFVYGDDGIRVTATHKIEADNNGTPATLEVTSDTLTKFLNDPQNHTGYSQVLIETTLDNLAGGAVLKMVISTLGHDLLAQTTITDRQGNPSGLTLHFLCDGHGSRRILTDAAGLIASVSGALQIFNYDAYGNALGFSPATAATNFLYSGEQFDQRLAMQYLRARYYDTASGRFSRLDPFSGSRHAPLSFGKYGYVHGNPVNGLDPSGQFFSAIGSLVVSGIQAGLRGLKHGAHASVLSVIRAASYVGRGLWALERDVERLAPKIIVFELSAKADGVHITTPSKSSRSSTSDSKISRN
jgi:RHS repeat-associated protein